MANHIPDIAGLQAKLSLPEKLSLLAGHSTWRTASIDRLSIPNLKFSDGPSGARGEIFGEGVPSAFLPCGVSLGATWDEDLIFQLGELLAEQTESKSASVILAPTICLHRHPLGGRNFEAFSEDPFLTGKLAVAHVRGVQSRGIGVAVKHYIANEQETNRFHYNAVILPRALREVYLMPFQMVVRDADPWCIMTAYNKVNGYHCDMSEELLHDIPRKEWGWDGVFISDWGGTNSTAESINAGLDIEMPGPPTRRSQSILEMHLRNGTINLKRVDESVERLLKLLVKTRRFEDATDGAEVVLDTEAHRLKLHEAACAGIVLLKNDHTTLPLIPSKDIKKLALIGPNAKKIVAGGGGSSYIKAPYWTSSYDSLKRSFEAEGTEVVYAEGAKVSRYLPTASLDVARDPESGTGGALLEWFEGHDLRGPPDAKQHIDDLYYISFGDFPQQIHGETNFGFILKTILTPRTSGRHRLSLASIGPSELYIDGIQVAARSGSFEEKENLFFTYGSGEAVIEYSMVAGQDYQVNIKYRSHDRQLREDLQGKLDPMEEKFQGVKLGFEEYDDTDLPAQAASIARDCDAVILVVGRDKEWETEGEDIPSFELPGEQQELIHQVAAVCTRTVVVVQAGTPVEMDSWIGSVGAVLYTWYQGQELGNSVASVITGKYNPSGRLPVTFPRRIADAPAFSSFPGEQHGFMYSEGLFVGHRWWDLHGTSPLFPIGFGLSYTEFELSESTISSTSLLRNEKIIVTITVRNIGQGDSLPGRQTILVWCSSRKKGRLVKPVKQICGFAKTPLLQVGQSHELRITLDAYGFGSYDVEKKSWVVVQDDEYDILVGTTAIDSVTVGRISVPEEIAWIHRL